MNDTMSFFHGGSPHPIAHFWLSLHRVERGEGEAKRVSYEAKPQVLFRPERVIVRARVKPGWLERTIRLFGWVRLPWVERRWVVEGMSDEEIERELLDDQSSEEEIRELLAVDPLDGEEDDEEDGDEEEEGEGEGEDTDWERREVKKVWRLKWVRPFAVWAARIAHKEQHEKLCRCFIKNIIVDDQELLVGAMVPIVVFLETSFAMRIDSPACRSKIEVPLEGLVPDTMDLVMIGVAAQGDEPPPFRVVGPSQPI